MPTPTNYSYTHSTDIPRLTQEVQASSIATALDHMTFTSPTSLVIFFKDVLSDSDKTTLDSLVSAHVATPLPENIVVKVSPSVDVDGVPLMRMKASKAGWTFSATQFEFSTSRLSSGNIDPNQDLMATDSLGNALTYVTVKVYDNNGTEITTTGVANANLANAVKSVVDFEPPFDYEVIGGTLRTAEAITENLRVWVVAVPDIPANQGGSKEMATAINMKFLSPGNVYAVDGRVTKYLSYNATYHTNKLRFIFKYPAGICHDLAILVEIYKG